MVQAPEPDNQQVGDNAARAVANFIKLGSPPPALSGVQWVESTKGSERPSPSTPFNSRYLARSLDQAHFDLRRLQKPVQPGANAGSVGAYERRSGRLMVIAVSSALILLGAVVTGTMALRIRAQRGRRESPQDQYKRSVRELQGGGIHPGGQNINPNHGYRIHRGDGGDVGGGGWAG